MICCFNYFLFALVFYCKPNFMIVFYLPWEWVCVLIQLLSS